MNDEVMDRAMTVIKYVSAALIGILVFGFATAAIDNSQRNEYGADTGTSLCVNEMKKELGEDDPGAFVHTATVPEIKNDEVIGWYVFGNIKYDTYSGDVYKRWNCYAYADLSGISASLIAE